MAEGELQDILGTFDIQDYLSYSPPVIVEDIIDLTGFDSQIEQPAAPAKRRRMEIVAQPAISSVSCSPSSSTTAPIVVHHLASDEVKREIPTQPDNPSASWSSLSWSPWLPEMWSPSQAPVLCAEKREIAAAGPSDLQVPMTSSQTEVSVGACLLPSSVMWQRATETKTIQNLIYNLH